MRLALSFLATSALLLGCAHPRTQEMGAAPEPETVCKDAKVLPPHTKCGLDKGVNRKATGAAADK